MPKVKSIKPEKNKKTLVITILQWVFLVLSIITFIKTVGDYQIFFSIKNITDLIAVLAYYSFFILPTLITLCLFIYTKFALHLARIFATILVIMSFFLFQWFLLAYLLGYFGISLDNKDFGKYLYENHRQGALLIQKDPSLIINTYGIFGMIGGFIVYGIPSLLLYIFYKATKYKD